MTFRSDSGMRSAMPRMRSSSLESVSGAGTSGTGTDGMGVHIETIDYERLDAPAVMRKGRASPPAHGGPAFDASEIPAFLRKQAD